MSVSELHTRLAARLPATATPVLVAGSALAACVAVALRDPNSPGSYGTCPFLAVTGLQCPGCGTLRALRALGQGQVGTAIGLNLLSMSVLPLLVWGWLGWFQHRRGHRDAAPVIPQPVAIGIAVAIPVFWVLRNVPVEPLSWLAP